MRIADLGLQEGRYKRLEHFIEPKHEEVLKIFNVSMSKGWSSQMQEVLYGQISIARPTLNCDPLNEIRI